MIDRKSSLLQSYGDKSRNFGIIFNYQDTHRCAPLFVLLLLLVRCRWVLWDDDRRSIFRTPSLHIEELKVVVICDHSAFGETRPACDTNALDLPRLCTKEGLVVRRHIYGLLAPFTEARR